MVSEQSEFSKLFDSFGTKCLCGIVGYRWDELKSDQKVVDEAGPRPVSSLVLDTNFGCMGTRLSSRKLSSLQKTTLSRD